MTPDQIAKSHTESAHQIAFFAYCAMAENHGFEVADMWASGLPLQLNLSKPIPVLKYIHHIPNGGARGDTVRSNVIRGGTLKAEGVRAGVPDICWPYPASGFHGLYIEMKAPKERAKKSSSKGGVSDEQADFLAYLNHFNYKIAVCYNWSEAVEELKKYFKS